MPTYAYGPCTNEECELFEQTYTHNKKMSEYKEPQPCTKCETMHERATNDYPTAGPILVGQCWARDGYQSPYTPVGNLMKNPTAKK